MIKKIKEMFNNETYSKQTINEYNLILKEYNQELKLNLLLENHEIKKKINTLRKEIQDKDTLMNNLPLILAISSIISDRILKLKPYEEQIIGVIGILNENIIEMATGEGKSLVGAISTIANSFIYDHISIATINDYLAKRDSDYFKEYYSFFNITVAAINNSDNNKERREKYSKTVVYATASEYCYDYLRSNLALHKDEKLYEVNRFFLLDEIDNILIDRAKRPIILTTIDKKSENLYKETFELLKTLDIDIDYTIEKKNKKIDVTFEGITKIENYYKINSLYTDQHINKLKYLKQAIYAKHFLLKDENYKIKDKKIIIIDQETKRISKGRRFNEGYQQSVEIKEGLTLSPAIKIKASISYQNFFRTVQSLSGMTATAITEEKEFEDIYGLKVLTIPTHELMIRKDLPDIIYQTEKYKNEKIVNDIKEIHKTGQPILIGCKNNTEMKYFSSILNNAGIKNDTLESKNHTEEANIIKEAGKINKVTLITNMAGRGTNIVASKEANLLGGLYIIGTTRQESRRIDYQLRGRTARQGAPGISRFYLSLEDEMMIKFGGSDVKNTLNKLKLAENYEIKSKFVDNLVNQIQQRCEENNKNIRGYLYEFDNIIGAQRSIIYKERNNVLESNFENLNILINKMFMSVAEKITNTICSSDKYPEDWDMKLVTKNINKFSLKEDAFNINKLPSLNELEKVETADIENFKLERIQNVIAEYFSNILLNTISKMKSKEKLDVKIFYKGIFLKTLDYVWEQQLNELDELKQGINLRTIGHENPILEYSFEAAKMFENLKIETAIILTAKILKVQFVTQNL